MNNRTNLNLKPGQRGRLTVEAKTAVVAESAVWKDSDNDVVMIDKSQQNTPFDVCVVAGQPGIAIVEFGVLDEQGERVLEHIFEIHVENATSDEDLIGSARVSVDSEDFPATTYVSENYPQQSEPAAEVAAAPETSAVDPDMMVGHQEDAAVNAEVEAAAEVAAETETASEPAGEASESEAETSAPVETGVETPAAAETLPVDTADVVVDEGNAEVTGEAEASAETEGDGLSGDGEGLDTSPVDTSDEVTDEGNVEAVAEPSATDTAAPIAEPAAEPSTDVAAEAAANEATSGGGPFDRPSF